MIKNCMEDIVEDLLPVVLVNYKGGCTCSRCIDDVKAIALNNLKPLYAASENGRLYNKMNEMKTQFRIDVINELTKAMEKVCENPFH
ncbi:late competence development ComFB family protein [Clostridium sp. YIM B02505]|uniref:Late competence development ComFB family protein n=1 Tax=Clostridium yunnanense TaxID=2800325 RepID=A0ABS1EJX1_9CLOT|nr:late competence development ComFB family protein [Clostridium yunnanense]MBK1809655.1 late competence development ComFB family protein [Clostridium yunnanense]